MRSKLFLLIIIFNCCFSVETFSQSINWSEVTSNYNLPFGVKLFLGTRTSPVLKTWYLEVDLKKSNIIIKPYLNPIGKEGITAFSSRFNTYAAINGGYFDVGSNASYSACVNQLGVLARNIASVTRSGSTYFITRGFFGMKETRELSIDWIYHFGGNKLDLYRYTNPTNNVEGTPAPAPSPINGTRYDELIAGIGGGPVLVKNGVLRITYTEEVFWGSGVGLDNRDPRTAVGFTANNKVIMLVADGRQAASEGFSLTELAQVMINLGCVEAMNLDGGGSTQMSVGNQLVNLPVGSTYQRTIPTMLAVVPADSLPTLPPIFYNKIIDTGDPDCSLIGSGWTASTISGYYGTTQSMYVAKGSGDKYAEFKLNLPQSTNYEISAWWTAASNRAKDVPFIIHHINGVDTVRVDQSINGSKWNRIGEWTFAGDVLDKVVISNAATQGDVVVADAIRILSFDSLMVSTKEIDSQKDLNFESLQNYPNPFNPVTKIDFTIPSFGQDGILSYNTSLKIYNILGNEIVTLINEIKSPGNYTVEFDGANLPSGVYFAKLSSGTLQSVRKIVLMK
jgi:hypothetical protein